MELLFLGTCACDYSPKLATEYKDKFDFNARRSSSVLIDGRILIDCGDHTLDSLRIADIDVKKITDIVITHLHHDHFRPDYIRQIAQKSDIKIWLREDSPVEDLGCTLVCMSPTVTYQMGNGISVTGLKSNHDEKSCPQYVYIESGDKKLLYATDGAWFLFETYSWLKNKHLTSLIIDATCGDYEGDYRMAEHNSIPMIKMMLPSLKKCGVVDDKTQIYLTHIAPSLHKSHNEIVKSVEEKGLKTPL